MGWLGCDTYPSTCEGGETDIVVDESAVPAVPDQIAGNCFEVQVSRRYADEGERALILRAEGLSSTVGSEWFGSAMSEEDIDADLSRFLIPDAVTDEAILFYAKRVRAYQTGELSGQRFATLRYRAFVMWTTEVNVSDVITVRLNFEYYQGRGALASNGIQAWREVDFDQAGDVVEVRGDGEAVLVVS